MKVRVERIRRGQRTAEVEYIITKAPRKRRLPTDQESMPAGPSNDPWNMDAQTAELRLPWRLNSRRA